MVRPLPFRLILASSSPARRELLEQAGYPFEVRPAGIDEPTEPQYGSCRQFVQHVCWLKAAAVAPRVESGLVIAADSVGWHDGRVVLKPEDEADARRILTDLGGTVHELWTGVTLWKRPGDIQVCWQEVSRVAVRAFTEAEMDEYIATRKWVGCSGAYSVEGPDDPFVRVVEGSISNVIGLPMETLERMLEWMRSLPQ